jgi:hypothetical protein
MTWVSLPAHKEVRRQNEFGVSNFLETSSMGYLRAFILAPTKNMWFPRQSTRQEDQTLNKLPCLRKQTYARVLKRTCNVYEQIDIQTFKKQVDFSHSN